MSSKRSLISIELPVEKRRRSSGIVQQDEEDSSITVSPSDTPLTTPEENGGLSGIHGGVNPVGDGDVDGDGEYSSTTIDTYDDLNSITTPDTTVATPISPDRGATPNAGSIISSSSSSAGKIRSIQMINIMCHSNLTLTLGDRMNFIVGRNGSGKSAALTAIIIGLGGRASDTNRAHGIADAIKEGETKGSIKITFSNEGIAAFKPHINGKSFTIERAISRTEKAGQSSYFIHANIDNKVKKRKTSKKEIDEILSHFQIDIDNQFAILTQDQARSFLVTTKPKEKYKLLMNALRVNQTREYKNASDKNLVDTQQGLKSKEGEIENLKKLSDELNAKQQLRAKLEEANKQQEWYKGMGLWAHYNDRMEKASHCEERIKDLNEQIAEKQSQAEVLASKKIEIENQHFAHISSTTELQSQSNEVDRDLQDAQNSVREVQDNIKSLKNEETNLNQQKNKIIAKKADVEKELEKLTSSEGGQNVLNEQLTLVKEEIANLEVEEQELRKERENGERLIQEADVHYKDLGKRLAPLHNRLDDSKNQLHELTKGDVSINDAYGRNMTSVLKEIKNTSSFQSTPIGPLGQYISIKMPEWSSILEQQMRFTLQAFWVQNIHDRDILFKILEKYRMTNSIITKDVDLFDYSSSCPDENYTTALDALDFKNEGVKRLIIDQHQLHRILLIDNRVEAEKTMYQRPQNSLYAYTRRRNKDGSYARDGFQIGSNVAGASASIKLKGTHISDAPKMIVDTSYRKHEIEESIREYKRQIQQLNDEIKEANRVLQKYKDDNRSQSIKLREISNRRKELDRKRDNLEAQLDELTDNVKVLNLQGEIEKYDEQITTYNKQFTGIRQSYTDKLEELEDNKQYLDKFKAHRQGILERLRSLQEEERAYEERIQNIESKRDICLRSISEMKRDINELNKQMEKYQDKANLYKEKAITISEEPIPLEEGMTVESIMEEIKKLKERKKIIEQESGVSYAEVVKQYQIANDAYTNAKNEYEQIDKVYHKLTKNSGERETVYESLQQNSLAEIKRSFKHNLEKRGFVGNLDITRDEISLNIDPVLSKVKRNVETLSGGEKSFSQIALLISIWQRIPSNLLALDEFDVFMDNANRRQSLEMVMDVLRTTRSLTQSIIITPQDMDLEDKDLNSDDITIQRMPDPERRIVSNV